LALLTAIGIWAGLTGRLTQWYGALWHLFENKAVLRDYLLSWGTLAPAVFIAIQALQVVVAPIPGEATGILGGFVFGGVFGSLYSSIGLLLGSAMAFQLANLLGRPFVNLVVSAHTMERFEFLTKRRGAVAAFVLFLIPGFPKDFLCLLLGLSPMRFLTFLLVCGIGRIPGTIMLGFSGSAAYSESWGALIAVGIFAACAVGLSVLYKDRIRTWVEEHSHKHDGRRPPEEAEPQDATHERPE
jgi:uncharacterized membrane protein YdjX (TVP38/TMEM64 family)